jgi:hypothetical protein
MRRPPGIGDVVVRCAVVGVCLLFAPATAPASVLETGVLTCEAAPGSVDSLICDFHGGEGPPEAYAGIVDWSPGGEMETATALRWSVVASLDQVQSGDLAGEYFAKGKAALVGGHGRSFTLRPLSEEGADAQSAPVIQKLTLIASN